MIAGEAFESAARRPFEDAGLLLSNNSADNAGYLAGYVVECSLKLLLVQSAKLTPKSLGHDLLALSGDALRLAVLIAPFVGRYAVPASADLEDMAEHWSPEIRYAPTGHIRREAAEKWLRAAEAMYESLVVTITLDGRIVGD